MKKITVIIKKKYASHIEKFFKKEKISKFFKICGKTNFKYEFYVTDLQTPEILESLKKIINGKGFITVNPTNLVYPTVEEKGAKKSLDELIKIGAKNFTKMDRNYILFTICAAMIACLGFLSDNIIILISAMIICPIMSPIMASSYSAVSNNKNVLIRGMKLEIFGIILIILSSFFISFLPNNSLELEISLASSNLLYSFLIALLIGIVSANSFLTGKYEHLTGAAVGISLLPPLTNAVLLFFEQNFFFALNSIYLFIANILGIHLSALIFFLIFKLKKSN